MISPDLAHYLLFSEVRTKWIDEEEVGSWRFQLQSLTGDDHFSGTGMEYMVSRDRVELLAVLRGLEALDQPSQVTLLTASRYVRRGFRHGLEQWRSNDWQWERFGRRVPVKHADLWQRVDNALLFHRVDCRLWRIDHSSEETRVAPIPRPHFPRRIRPTEETRQEHDMQLAAG